MIAIFLSGANLGKSTYYITESYQQVFNNTN